MPAFRPSMAAFGDDPSNGGGAAWAKGQSSLVAPPAGIQQDPNVMWLDPGLLLEPGTGFGAAQKQEALGQAIDAAQQFLDGGGGGGPRPGGGVDPMQAAGTGMETTKKLAQFQPEQNMSGVPLSPGEISSFSHGQLGELGLGQFSNAEAPDVQQVNLGFGDDTPGPANVLSPELYAALRELTGGTGALDDLGTWFRSPEVEQAFQAQRAGERMDFGGSGAQAGAGLDWGGALTPALSAAMNLYGGIEGLTSGETSQQLTGAGQSIAGLIEAIKAYQALTSGASTAASTAGSAGSAAGGATSGLAAASSAIAPVISYLASQPSATPRAKFYNEGERNTAAVTETLAAIAAPFTFGFSVAGDKLLQNLSGMGREGKEAFQRLSQSGNLMDALNRSLTGITPENMDAVLGGRVEMNPAYDYETGMFTVPKAQLASSAGQMATMDPDQAYQQARDAFQRRNEEGAPIGDLQAAMDATQNMGDASEVQRYAQFLQDQFAKQFEGSETFGYDDPRAAGVSMPLEGTVGSMLAGLAADPSIGYGQEFLGGKYTANPLIRMQGGSEYGRVGSIGEMVAKIAEAESGDDRALMGQSRYEPFLNLLAALDQLNAARG